MNNNTHARPLSSEALAKEDRLSTISQQLSTTPLPRPADFKPPTHADEYWLFPLPRPRRPNLFYRSLAEALRSRPAYFRNTEFR